MEWIGCTQRNLGNLEESERLLVDAVRRYTLIGAGDSDACMKTTAHLATTLFELQRLREASHLQRHIVEVRSRMLGRDDPATLGSLRNLAVTLWSLGDTDEAREVAASVLDRSQRLYDQDDPRIQQAKELMNGLAETADPDT